MRTLLIIFITLFIIAIGIAGIIFFISPKNTTITAKQKKAAFTKLLGRDPILTEKVRSNAYIQYKGTYLTFSYPSAAKEYVFGDKPDNKTVLESFQFQETNNPRYHFVTQVEVPSNEAFQYNDVSGIRLRRLQNTIYTESSLASPVGNWVVFIKTDETFEKTAFLLAGGKLFTFSITGSDPVIEKIFDTVVSSVSITHQ